MKNLVKDTIHANGIDIGIYTQDFENEFMDFVVTNCDRKTRKEILWQKRRKKRLQ